MSELAKILFEKQIFLDVQASDVNSLFRLASSNFSSQSHLNEDLIFNCLQDREKLGSTGLGLGVAIPHGRVKGLKNPLISFYRLEKGIDYGSSDSEPVDISIFLLVPEVATQLHLELLSEIAQTLADKNKREVLRCGQLPNEILDALTI
ncbi:PTS sugar transporter subunit IIA [Polynucleobacter kasalickyi]|uniref:PTS IIA-like nitrogen-regulatory protein PtsN n=1 Tax=Polynucleobacter kasalickyi TaxID=1938817 RepID=A0A1W2ARN6_9BURK|nr:PTS sugar transporter subunit IIA [Polynucleobacter kasalickyi]SMC62868.1 PTS IIA-like nitrogen-regulatory protein PtsN [Polynucleobacter kasalickyi]